jgi:hypothetical protein
LLRTGPGTATDGLPKFDLSRLNQAYFDRLRLRAACGRSSSLASARKERVVNVLYLTDKPRFVVTNLTGAPEGIWC